MDKKRIVIPGELLSDDPAMSGSGTYISGGKVYASVCGLLTQKGKLSVHPLTGPYMPKRNDLLIGYVTVVTSSNWIFDINCPYEGLLHVTEYPLRVPSEEMTQHFGIGDTVLLKVTDVNAEMKVELTYKDPVCKKLTRGRLFEVPFSKVSRIIGRSGAMISMLKAKTGCDIFVGGNGRIWMNGDSTDMDILMSALKKIESDARLPGLTDLTAAFIDEQYEAAGRKAHDVVQPKKSKSVSESVDSVPEKKAKTVTRKKKSDAVEDSKQVIESAEAALEELPKKERKSKKAAEKDSKLIPAVGKSVAVGDSVEDAAVEFDFVQNETVAPAGSDVKKSTAKRPRLTQPEAFKQENCSCFKSVFFTHPPVHQGNKSDR
ncbi:exosome complex RNA-binding protein Rrp4 [Methanimicrococcus blatticola]|uniref:Exosome complex component Rrp4 n=1 Tax=Methanimicrococcus blatticola TaxID=91560 RepID=A0A484F7Q2_9EURY|nr:exosome complex RNA-binding protein Rrp4 [Methanimicrococcus blatticola]MBZ3935001.1 RNA-binding protein [Methanimicrococcus blatticola]MCC2508901.1 RNA-binding protein [Methanimicrococcus blatticola]TDQ71071.1 exosome complex component RRP4 [Methanimicrococcus blatticola]